VPSTNPSHYTYTETPLDDLLIVTRGVFRDHRGVFEKPHISNEYAESKIFINLQEVNLSLTNEVGTIRGFHQQIEPNAETKIVTCVSGSVFDCVIDMRGNSKTFGGIFTIKLIANSGVSLMIPKGFAHGFQSLEASSALLYCVDSRYSPKSQTGINPLSPELIDLWPLKAGDISEQDKSQPLWADRVNSKPWRP
jgi:dTDP-4-dehydrorhamnose 3,5-epimerase